MRERAPARIAGFSRTDRCSHEREPGLGRSRSQANAGDVAICATGRGWFVRLSIPAPSPPATTQRTPPPEMEGDGGSPWREGDRLSAPWP
jgi:hypothetical protein